MTTSIKVPSAPFSLHTLDASSPQASIGPVLELSNAIFNTDASNPTHHSSLEEWCTRLGKEDSIIVYSTVDESVDSPSEDATPVGQAREVVGFVFAHVKTDAALPYPTLHVWLAGVSERARGTGVFMALMGIVEAHARSLGVKGLSVATFPDTFAKMYAILLKQGWEAREWKEGGRKVLMMKTL